MWCFILCRRQSAATLGKIKDIHLKREQMATSSLPPGNEKNLEAEKQYQERRQKLRQNDALDVRIGTLKKQIQKKQNLIKSFT